MPILTLRESDPQGQLRAAPDSNSGSQNALEMLAGVLGVLKKRKNDKMDEAFRNAATASLQGGGGQVGYEYDPKAKSFKYKVSPKKEDSLSAKVQRFVTGQQFGVDPVTGQPIQNPLKPRFGYTGDVLAQILGGQVPGGGGAPAPAPAAPAGGGGGSFFLPAAQAAQIDMPADSGPGGPQFMDPLELEAQNAIAAGKDPKLVKARLQELMRAKAAANGGV